jgi:hypothetical protein
MKLRQFIKKYSLPGNMTLDHIALIHPKTKEKIYIISNFLQGIWYRKIKGSAKQNGQMWPYSPVPDIQDLQVHKNAKKELDLK